MVKYLEYHKGTKVKLWIDELPDTIIGNFSFLSGKTNVNGTDNWENRKLAIEVALQKHNSSYGLLGLEFISTQNQGNLSIEVHYGDKNSSLFNDTLAYNRRTVFSALPEEFAETVLKRAIDFINNNPDLPSGKIVFKAGAHCEVGSSKALFGIITDILLSILLLGKGSYNTEGIKEILDRLLVFR